MIRLESIIDKESRAYYYFYRLQYLVKKYGIRLSKEFTINDNPNELEIEYFIQKKCLSSHKHDKFYQGYLCYIRS